MSRLFLSFHKELSPLTFHIPIFTCLCCVLEREMLLGEFSNGPCSDESQLKNFL